MDRFVLETLALSDNLEPDLTKWKAFLARHKNPKNHGRIGLVGKYVELQDSYKSILEAFIHAGAANEVMVDVVSIHSEHLTVDNCEEQLKDLHGWLVAPGFGSSRIEGTISAIKYVSENNIPFFGMC